MSILGRLRDFFGGGGNDIDAFLYFGEWLPMESSNVAGAQYVMEDGKLTVEFLNGTFYEVTPISVEEARSFATAPSKGKWYWDNVRVRGTKLGEQKNVVFVSGPSSHQPKWMKTREERQAHGRTGPGPQRPRQAPQRRRPPAGPGA